MLRKTHGFQTNYKYDYLYFIRSTARHGKFRILSTQIHVSARRFEVYGIWQTLYMYLLLSICFIFGAHGLANNMIYPFGQYKKRLIS